MGLANPGSEAWTTFRTILDACPDATVLVARDGRIVLVNTQTETLFGYAPGAMIGLDLEALVPESVRTSHQAHREGFFAHPTSRPMSDDLELMGRCADGREFPVEISLSSVEIEGGILAVAGIRDVTARKRAEAVALELVVIHERMKADLLQILAHELFTPIATIQGTALTLLNTDQLSKDVLSDLSAGVVHASARLKRLVGNINASALLDRPSTPVSTSTERVVDLLGHARRAFADDAAIEQRAQDDTLDRRVLVDLELTAQALVILLENALDIQEGKSVQLEIEAEGNQLRILVTDQGPGVPEAMREQIFELFEQVDASATRSHEGLGIGLFLARRIARANGGDIDLAPDTGKGATFRLSLPLLPADAV